MGSSATSTAARRVRFGDVVRQVRDKVDPGTSGLVRYVAGEHMDTDDLRLRRWGEISGNYLGPAFHMRFKPGHVLYGSRRTYLRKVAIAGFPGICANTTFVLEPKEPAALLPELLPFLMQTAAFHAHSIKQSKGSVNPYVNFSDLAWWEFVLPPRDQQASIVGLLQATRDVVDATADAHRSAVSFRTSVFDAVFGRAFAPAGTNRPWPTVRAEELVSAPITKGETPSDELSDQDSGIPFLKVYNLTFSGELDFTVSPTFISRSAHKRLQRSTVQAGDVLMNIVGPPLGKVSRLPQDFPEANINQAIARYRPRDRATGDWLCWYLQSRRAQGWLEARSKKTSGQRNLTLELCRDLPVPVGSDESRGRAVETIHAADAACMMTLARHTDAQLFSASVRESALLPLVTDGSL